MTSSVVNPIKIVAIEYDFSIAFMSRPENLLITQKYPSFAWDIIMEPAPMDKTASNFPPAESNPNAGSNGKTIDEEVMIATKEKNNITFFKKNKIKRKKKKKNK